jgi:hypothetical protein
MRVFLAHEDIEPTAKWRDKIISDLQSCSIFIALRTKDYLHKQYTEQECGFALALNKRILSLNIGVSTSEMGFCSEYQAKSFKPEEIDKIFGYRRACEAGGNAGRKSSVGITARAERASDVISNSFSCFCELSLVK